MFIPLFFVPIKTGNGLIKIISLTLYLKVKQQYINRSEIRV